jgi:hypothetical protein
MRKKAVFGRNLSFVKNHFKTNLFSKRIQEYYFSFQKNTMNKTIFSGLLVLILAISQSCQTVYNKEVMPKSGQDVSTFSPGLTGVYKIFEINKKGEKEGFKKHQVGDAYCIFEQTQPNIVDFYGFMAFSDADLKIDSIKERVRIEKDSLFLRAEKREKERAVPYVKISHYYLYNKEKVMSLDLGTKQMIEFRKGEKNDSIAKKDMVTAFILKQKNNRFYFNTSAEDSKLYQTFIIDADENGNFQVRFPFAEGYKEHEAEISALTPIEKVRDDLIIQPSDEALEQIINKNYLYPPSMYFERVPNPEDFGVKVPSLSLFQKSDKVLFGAAFAFLLLILGGIRWFLKRK